MYKTEKYPSSIRCWDSNSRPLKHESPPITTRQWIPALPAYTFLSIDHHHGHSCRNLKYCPFEAFISRLGNSSAPKPLFFVRGLVKKVRSNLWLNSFWANFFTNCEIVSSLKFDNRELKSILFVYFSLSLSLSVILRYTNQTLTLSLFFYA